MADGDEGLYILQNDLLASIYDDKSDTPRDYRLSQNYPNPFNATTTISYHVPASSFVSLKVYDITGQLIATLVNGQKKPGTYTVMWDVDNVSSGVYYYIIKAGNYTQARKSILIK